MNVRIAFKNTLQGKNEGRLLFVPFVHGLAAKMANISLREMVSDPTYYAYSLEGAYKLFHYDVITNNFDASVEAEACGCELEWGGEFEPPVVRKSGEIFKLGSEDFINGRRIAVLIEVTKRLAISLGREAAIVGAVTGPCSLMKSLQGQAANSGSNAIPLVGSFLTRLVRSLCELKIDALFFREDLLEKGFLEELYISKDSYKAVYATLFNIVRAYNSFPTLIVKNLSLEVIKELHALLKPNGVILFGQKFDNEELIYLKDLSDSLKMCFGLPLPVGVGSQDDLWNQIAIIKAFVTKHGPKGFYYTSDGEIPYHIPLEMIHDLMHKVILVP